MINVLMLLEEAMEDSSYGSDTHIGIGSGWANRASIQEMKRTEIDGVLSDCMILFNWV